MPPNLDHEQAVTAPVAGVDEVGRGPWAGPVVACAVILDSKAIPAGLDDSKNLSAARRESLAAELLAKAEVGLGQVEAADIDRMNILAASMLAMERAVAALPRRPAHALVDGNRAPKLSCPVTTVIKGDGRSVSIAAASIVAKVTRDRLMAELASAHPGYGWERNAGYGTAEHRAGLNSRGVTEHHRRSFKPIAALLNGP